MIDPEVLLLWAHRIANVILTCGCAFLAGVLLIVRKRHDRALAWIARHNFGLLGGLLGFFAAMFLIDFTCIGTIRPGWNFELFRIVVKLAAAVWVVFFCAHVVRFRHYVDQSLSAIARDQREG